MADIKIDVSQVLKDYFIPLMIAIFVGLLSYAIFFDTWLWPAIICVGTFLLVELLIWICKLVKESVLRSEAAIVASEKEKRQQQINHQLALSFYTSLNASDKDLAMEIFNYPSSDTASIYERFIEPKSNLGWRFENRLSSFQRGEEIPYISFINYQDCKYHGALQHVYIDPVFYRVLEQISKSSNTEL